MDEIDIEGGDAEGVDDAVAVLGVPEVDEAYLGARGSRGGLLPRGWQKVDGLAVES